MDFSSHIVEALSVNIPRSFHYGVQTRGKSCKLSFTLIGLEFLSLIPAVIFDIWAGFHRLKGYPVLKHDFIPIRGHISEAGKPPLHQKVGSPELTSEVRCMSSIAKKNLFKAIKANEFDESASICTTILARLKKAEELNSVDFPMTKHIYESLARASLNAAELSSQSKGKTNFFYRSFLRIQVLALSTSVWADHEAQKCHALGAGILTHDLPEIPLISAAPKRLRTKS